MTAPKPTPPTMTPWLYDPKRLEQKAPRRRKRTRKEAK